NQSQAGDLARQSGVVVDEAQAGVRARIRRLVVTPQFVKVGTLVSAWGRLLRGYSPLLSIEITRECPLHCPGCYAYDDNHLGGEVTLRQLRDLKGDDLVDGVLDLVRRHRPVQVSFVGGEPLIRHKELSRIMPIVSEWGIFSLVVTSAVT